MTPTEQQLGPTVCAEDVGEDGSEVLVLGQFINHLCQAAGGHLEEGGQTLGQASVDEELSQRDGAELQQSG